MDYKKRKAQTIQEMLDSPERKKNSTKSGYQGAYKPSNMLGDNSKQKKWTSGDLSSGYAENIGNSDRLQMIIFVIALFVCLIVSLITYLTGGSSHSRSGDYSYPSYVFTINGVLTDIYTGKYEQDRENSLLNEKIYSDNEVNSNSNGTYSVDNSNIGVTGGAPMQLDDGTFALSFPEAGSYDELLTQMQSAIASNDIKFVGSKIGYFDGSATRGYPESVVEIFTSYMAGNADKRNTFLESIKDETKFGSKNGDAYIVSLPIISFKVTTDYADTTFSFSGFSEQIISPGQQATVSPLLPCMYQITANCSEWDNPIEGPLEATFGENLEVNFGKN